MVLSAKARHSSADDEDLDEVVDLNQFQADLDASVDSVRAMIDSWMPKDLGPRWNVDFGTSELELRPAGSVHPFLCFSSFYFFFNFRFQRCFESVS